MSSIQQIWLNLINQLLLLINHCSKKHKFVVYFHRTYNGIIWWLPTVAQSHEDQKQVSLHTRTYCSTKWVFQGPNRSLATFAAVAAECCMWDWVKVKQQCECSQSWLWMWRTRMTHWCVFIGQDNDESEEWYNIHFLWFCDSFHFFPSTKPQTNSSIHGPYEPNRSINSFKFHATAYLAFALASCQCYWCLQALHHVWEGTETGKPWVSLVEGHFTYHTLFDRWSHRKE